jgi:serine protease Do
MLMTALNAELAAIAVQLQRSTVQIRGRRTEAGSGVVWQDGLILTNAHVVRGSSAIVELADGHTCRSEVTRRDDRLDLVALRVHDLDLPPVAIGAPGALRVGDLVFALGNPLGQVGAITMGILHALPTQQNWLQADIRLAPGNSGGALANAQGQVIGITTLMVNGLGFAIPSDAIEQFLRAAARPYLGVTLQPVMLPDSGDRRPAWLVLEVANGSPAGGHLLPGDVLIGTGGQRWVRLDDLAACLSAVQVGDTLLLELMRGGERQTRLIVMQPQPPQARAA